MLADHRTNESAASFYGHERTYICRWLYYVDTIIGDTRNRLVVFVVHVASLFSPNVNCVAPVTCIHCSRDLVMRGWISGNNHVPNWIILGLAKAVAPLQVVCVLEEHSKYREMRNEVKEGRCIARYILAPDSSVHVLLGRMRTSNETYVATPPLLLTPCTLISVLSPV